MYRLSLAALWAGAVACLILGIIDAMIDFMGHLQGLFLAGMAACAVCAVLHAGLHRLNDTAITNRGKSEDLRGDVDDVRAQVDDLGGKVGEVRDLTEAVALMREAEKAARDKAAKAEPERDAVIYQFRIKSPDGADIIAGDRSPNHAAADEILAVLDANDPGTMPGRLGAS